VSDRPTDQATRSVTIGHIYVCSTAMQPNNVLNPIPAEIRYTISLFSAGTNTDTQISVFV